MKLTSLATPLLALALAWPAQAAPANPAEFTIAVHVRSSRVVNTISGKDAPMFQHLTVLIDGKKHELDGPGADLLRVGDYKAKVKKDITNHPYEYQRVYEFLFSDGSTRQYWVVGEGE
jgi:hypothetical protein